MFSTIGYLLMILHSIVVEIFNVSFQVISSKVECVE